MEKQVAGADKMPQTEDRPDSILQVLWEKNEGELPRRVRLMSIRAGFVQRGRAVGAYNVTMIPPCIVAAVADAGRKAYGARASRGNMEGDWL